MKPGERLNDRYRLERRVGMGGMGEVWRAVDTMLERVVAVKVLRPDLSDNAESLRRFRQEALTLAGLNVPGAARIHDCGEAEVNGDLIAYLVMEFVEGKTLRRLLTERGHLAAAELLPILAQIAETLDVAHRNGVIHRDIKPGNIMVAPDGRATLLDFGIAQSVEDTKLTLSGQFMGTLSYVSPEQFKGDPVGPESDVYSLGVVAHECLTGEPPYTGGAMTILNGHLRQSPPRAATAPTVVARAVRRALAKAPADRFSTATEFIAACGGTPARTRPGRVRRRLLLAGAGLATAALVTAAVLFAPTVADSGTFAAPDKDEPWVPEGLAEGRLFDSQNGVIYRTDAAGRVYWYRHLGFETGDPDWDRDSGHRIGGDWKDREIVSACNGVLYARDDDGDLYWYQHIDPTEGGDEWAEESGVKVGEGFEEYTDFINTSQAAVYTVDGDGNLAWWLHPWPADGDPMAWAPRSGRTVSDGWDRDSVRLASGCDNGLMYTVNPKGELVWWLHHSVQGGSSNIDDRVIAEGWDGYESIISSTGGVLYARDGDGDLYWYRHLTPEAGTPEWAEDKGRRIT